jgi:Ca2+-binding EF-hand superfamily protein
MWEKIKKWFGFLDLNKDGKVSAEDLELARALADKKAKEANETINAVVEAADKIKKVRRKK